MKKIIFILGVILLLALIFAYSRSKQSNLPPNGEEKFWTFQSIDTMKYSRDLARQKLNDASFDQTIDLQVKSIAQTGATHIALATPYDNEFIVFLTRWVSAARKYNLKVWFRGNFSGWEEWFGYKPITREEHMALIKNFILDNGSLFEDGDVFSPCPECENGGPGDPRANGDVVGHRQFLIDEYKTARDAFRKIGKNVASNYHPMNGDVARLVMDAETTQALGGLVVIDHYVSTPDKLAADVKDIARVTGGKVILGEFGAPIPDIHGQLTDSQQAEWIGNALVKLSKIPELTGISYWTSFGGSTELWMDDGEPRPAVGVLTNFYSPNVFKGYVLDGIGRPITNAVISSNERSVTSASRGNFSIPYLPDETSVKIKALGYKDDIYPIDGTNKAVDIMLVKEKESIAFKVRKLLFNIFKV
jgi:hypothetical protein